MLKIQSARATLAEVDDAKYPHAGEIETCLESADQHLKSALGYARPDSTGRTVIEQEDAEDEKTPER